MTSSDKEKEKTGGLVHAIALNPLDPAHLVHNGCDKGLERFQIGVGQQRPEDVGEIEAWIAEGHLHQHLLKNSRANLARLVGQLLWDLLPKPLEGHRHALEEQAELGAGLEMLVGRIPKSSIPNCANSSSMTVAIFTRPSVQCSTVSPNEYCVTAMLASSASSALIFSDKVTSRSLASSSV